MVYALPEEQVLISLDVEQGTTAEQAVKLSGILDKFSDIDLTKNKLGIFGKATKADQVLRDKDRVEIYRPLIADPKSHVVNVLKRKRLKRNSCYCEQSAAIFIFELVFKRLPQPLSFLRNDKAEIIPG